MSDDMNERALELCAAIQFLRQAGISYHDSLYFWDSNGGDVYVTLLYTPPRIKNPVLRLWKWFTDYNQYFLGHKVEVFRMSSSNEVKTLRDGKWQDVLLQEVARIKAQSEIDPFLPIDDEHLFTEKNAQGK